MTNSRKKGFTLLELLIVITILAILTLVVVLFINPVEILKKSRDVQRMSDLDILRTAINLYLQDSASNTLGGTTYCASSAPISETATGNAAVKASLADATPTTSLTFVAGQGFGGTTPTYTATTSDASVRNDNWGWVKGIDFTSVGSGAPIAKLPIDPTNVGFLTTIGSGTPGIDSLYYRYACRTNNTFELDATLESLAYGPTSTTDNKAARDGGDSIMRYEVGTDLRIIPSSAPILASGN